MTDQSPNDQFRASSFMQGHNAEYLEQLYARYAADPGAVDEAWRRFFEELGDDSDEVTAEAAGPSWARADWPPMPQDDLTGALTGQYPAEPEAKAVGRKLTEKAREKGVEVSDQVIQRAVLDSVRALMLIRAYRIRGHLIADLDPLGLREQPYRPELDPESYGFTGSDWDRPIFIDNVLGLQIASIREIMGIVRRTYCGTFALQFMHISDPEQAGWLKERIEGYGNEISFTREGRKAILNKMVEAEGFEKFLHVKYMGTKRFGLDGGESLIPAMEQIIKRGGSLGVEEIVIGMPHRGRLSVLANVMGKPYRAIFNEFQGGSFKPDDVDGSGDVKYHLGASSNREFDGNKVHLSLTANPSHLEAVNPVVLGKVRAKQDQLNDTQRAKVLPLLLHGDAAFAGQGVVAECFGLSGLKGHRTGGTMHIVVNNQIGFTTAPHFSRSSPYPTDIALMVEAPIFHVNGDDPEAVVHAAKVATEFRQKFNKDVVIDIICYRRFGHNEGDEPMFTNPMMYKNIKQHKTTLTLYTERLVKDGLIPDGEVEDMRNAFQSYLSDEFEAGTDYRPNKADWLDGKWAHLDRKEEDYQRGQTAIQEETFHAVGTAITRVPDGFPVHKTVQRILDAKAQMFESGTGFDWATGEALAFGSLLLEGFPVRLSGQDSVRGTFSQRHSALINQNDEERYYPLNNIREGQARYEAIELDAQRICRARLRVWLYPGGAQRADPLGGAVRRFRQRRADHVRPVHFLGRIEMAAHVGPRLPAAPRLRGAGSGTFIGPAGAVPDHVRAGQLDRRQLHHAGQLFPHPAPAASPHLPQAADPDDAEIASAAQAGHLEDRGFHRRQQLPPGAVGRCAIWQFRHHAGPGRSDQARRHVFRQGLLRSAGRARQARDRRHLPHAVRAVLSLPRPIRGEGAGTLQAGGNGLVPGRAQEPGRLALHRAEHRMGSGPHRGQMLPSRLCRPGRGRIARDGPCQPAQSTTRGAR